MKRTFPVICFLTLIGQLFCLVATIQPARAHDLGLSGIRILYRPNDLVISVMTPISQLLKSEKAGQTAITPVALDLAIRKRLHIRLDGREVQPQSATIIHDNASDIVSWQSVFAGTPRHTEVLARLYPEDAGSRTVVTLIKDGQAVQEVILDAAHPALLESQSEPPWRSVALRYLQEGISHIFSGPDHLLFIFGLLLLGGDLRALLKTVTAFTLAHSITLTVAATGLWNPSPRIVEPLIALSIVAIAVENLRHLRQSQDRKTIDLRPGFAFVFGLVHGFGFAGALSEVGLPASALWVALGSFNLGVEAGQATIVIGVSPFLAYLTKRHPPVSRHIILLGSLVIGAAGLYWFFARL